MRWRCRSGSNPGEQAAAKRARNIPGPRRGGCSHRRPRPRPGHAPRGGARRVLSGAGRGRAGLLVRVLAVDEGREACGGEAIDVLPDVEDRPARGVHQDTAARPETGQLFHRHAERREDDDVQGTDRLQPRAAPVRLPQEPDPHLFQAGVDVRVVNDLADQVDRAIGKFSARLVGVFDGAVDPVAKTKLAASRKVSLPACSRWPEDLSLSTMRLW